jgi:hypothetical protein
MLARSLRFTACFNAYGAGHLGIFIKLQVGDRNLRHFVLKRKNRFLGNIEGKKRFGTRREDVLPFRRQRLNSLRQGSIEATPNRVPADALYERQK